uniref:membrane protein n=1 Tax=Xanthomonas phaseoli TaxID=1985254 RepID=UPI00052877DC
MKTLVLGALVMGLVVAGNATAQRYDSGYEDGRYEYARVVRVDPIIVADSYNERTSERCYDRPADGYYTSNDGYYRDGGYAQAGVSNRGVASVIGGIAGAVLGSQVGGGNGRLGTMAGVAAGRSIYEGKHRTHQGHVRGWGAGAFR